MTTIQEILVFVQQKPRTRTEVRARFLLSSSESYSKLRFLIKCGDLEMIDLTGQTGQTSHVGRITIYQQKKGI